MKRVRIFALVAALSLTATAIPSGASWAAEPTALTLHYHASDAAKTPVEQAFTVAGDPGAQTGQTRDGDWVTTTFSFPSVAADAQLGFTVSNDSVYPSDKRFVVAADGKAEAWLIDGDAQVYGSPKAIDPSLIVKKDLKAYVAVEDLGSTLGLTYKYGKNGYAFDGAPTGTVDILTIYRGRDYFEINVGSNRIGSNVTGNMLKNYTDVVFSDVDGFQKDGKYYLSFGYIERLFQVGTLSTDQGAFVLPRQFVAYNTLQNATSPESVGFSSAGLAAVDDYVKAQADNGGPSLAVSVVKDGKIVKESAYGYAKKYDTPLVDGQYQPAKLLPQDQWQPATVDTLYDLASNTKMYATNYAIQRLVSEGKLDLNQTLQSFPGWQDYTDANSVYTGDWTVGGAGGITAKQTGKSTITIADLLHHSAGEIPDPQYQNRNVAGELYYQNPDYHDRAGIIAMISKTPLMLAPRTKYLYSDVDFMILGLIVEQVTGQSLDSYVKDNIYAPLGLTHTTFNPLENGFSKDQIAATELNGNTRDGNVSFGNLPDGSPVPIRKYTLQGEVHDEKAFYTMGGVSGHAGLFSTVGDMAVLTQLMLNGGLYNGDQVFSKKVADQFTTPYSANPATVDSSTIGLGWELHSKSAAAYYYFNWGPSRSTYGHEGWTGTLTIIDPTYDMTITILTNMRHSPVVDPPNGFEDSDYPIADMVPVSARIYQALTASHTQYSPIASVSPVAGVSVAAGTSAADARAALPATTTVVDAAGISHSVAVTWDLAGYQGDTAGEYAAHGTVALPASVVQADPAIPLTVDSTVTVTGAPGHGVTATLDAPRVRAGDSVGFHGTGFGGGESVAVELHSDPVALGSFTADAAGNVHGTITIPASTDPGTHRVQLTGTDSKSSALTDPFTVTARGAGSGSGSGSGASSGGGLANTGLDLSVGLLAALLLFAAGGVSLVLRRRRIRRAG